MPSHRNLRAEFRKLLELDNSPESKARTLVEIRADGGKLYQWLTPRERAIKELVKTLPVSFEA